MTLARVVVVALRCSSPTMCNFLRSVNQLAETGPHLLLAINELQL